MIKYHARGLHHLTNLCRLQGSVFHRVFGLSALAGVLAYTCKQMQANGNLAYSSGDGNEMMSDNAVWSGINYLVGFLIVFRSSQAYSRFWEGCTCIQRMHAEWVDASSSLIAFCKHSHADPLLISDFKNRLARLVSMLHALCLAEIEDCNSEKYENISAYSFEVIDGLGLDRRSLLAVKGCDAKVELVFQWIQQLLVEAINSGVLSIPAPICSRAFQQLAAGLVSFHDCLKVSSVPFPFPYAQTCDALLVMHFLATPLVMAQWCTQPAWAAIFAFMQVFFLWGLNSIACEIENPFGEDLNDIDTHRLQWQMNRHLYQIIDTDTQHTPTLVREALRLEDSKEYSNSEHLIGRNRCNLSFIEIWSVTAPEEESLKIMRTHRTMDLDTLQPEALPRTVRMKKEMLSRLLAMTESVERHTTRESVPTGGLLRFLRSTLKGIDQRARQGTTSVVVTPSERRSAVSAMQASFSSLSEHTVGVPRSLSFATSLVESMANSDMTASHACGSTSSRGGLRPLARTNEDKATAKLREQRDDVPQSVARIVPPRELVQGRALSPSNPGTGTAEEGNLAAPPKRRLSKASALSDVSNGYEGGSHRPRRVATAQPLVQSQLQDKSNADIVLIDEEKPAGTGPLNGICCAADPMEYAAGEEFASAHRIF